jgi:hypothetical protein
MVRWRKKGQFTQLHALALRTGWSVAGNLPATGTVILTMPYTLSRHPHIVNKLTIFSRQVIRETNALLLICYSMTKMRALFCIAVIFWGGLEDVLCGFFLFLCTLSFFLWTGKSAIEFGQSSVDP